ncbi:MAG: hypothetical protein ACYDD1_04670 [Caulobacteraceae bacterium]
MTIQYNSDNATNGFDATAAATLPTGWASVTGTWKTRTDAAVIGSHTQSFGDTSGTSGDLAVYTAVSSADMECTCTQMMYSGAGATQASVGIGVRGQAATATVGYLFNLSRTAAGFLGFQFFRKTSATAYTAIGTAVTTTFAIPASQSVAVNMRVSIVGSVMTGTAWPVGTVEPTPGSANTASVTDTNVAGAGYPFLYSGSNLSSTVAVGITDFAFNDNPAAEAAGIGVLTPASGVGTATVSGTYAGTAPTGLNISLDGGTTFTAVASPTISGGTFSFALPSLAAGYHTLVLQAANATTETTATPAFQVTSVASVQVAPNSSTIFYSPSNWNVAASAATTVNPGAYFKTRFTGASCTLNFNVASMTTSISQIWYRIDGFGPWTQVNVAATVSCTMPSLTAAWAEHFLEVVIKSTTEFQFPTGQSGQRWNPASSPCSAVIFTGLTLAANATSTAPTAFPVTGLIFGDSITEGYKTVQQPSASVADVDASDAKLGWAYSLGAALGAELGVVGFGGQGYGSAGVGGVPVFGSTLGSLYSGVARSFTGLNFVYVQQGENDGTNALTTTITSNINALLAALPVGCILIFGCPFSGKQAANIQAAIAACSSPASVFYVSTLGLFNTADSYDGQHPQGCANLGVITAGMVALLKPLIAPNQGNYPTTTTAASTDMAVVVKSGVPQNITITNLKAAVAASS